MNNFQNAFFHHMHHINRHSSHLFGQEKILIALLDKEVMTQAELLEVVEIKASSLSETLSRLEKKKLVTRNSEGDDRRRNEIALTKRGAGMAKRYKKYQEKFEARMFGSLTAEEKGQMMSILEKMHYNIDDDERSHFHFRGRRFGFGEHGHHGDHSHHYGNGRDDKDSGEEE